MSLIYVKGFQRSMTIADIEEKLLPNIFNLVAARLQEKGVPVPGNKELFTEVAMSMLKSRIDRQTQEDRIGDQQFKHRPASTTSQPPQTTQDQDNENAAKEEVISLKDDIAALKQKIGENAKAADVISDIEYSKAKSGRKITTNFNAAPSFGGLRKKKRGEAQPINDGNVLTQIKSEKLVCEPNNHSGFKKRDLSESSSSPSARIGLKSKARRLRQKKLSSTYDSRSREFADHLLSSIMIEEPPIQAIINLAEVVMEDLIYGSHFHLEPEDVEHLQHSQLNPTVALGHELRITTLIE